MNNASDSNRSPRVTSAATNDVGAGGEGSSSHNHVKAEKNDATGTPTNNNNNNNNVKTLSNNAGIKNDIESRSKNLTMDQIKEKLTLIVTELKNMEEYHHGDGMKYQKVIGDMYWDYPAEREDIGNFLADLGYAEITITMLRQMNSLGIFKNDDIWFPTYYTYNTCWNYSDASEKLARYLAETGAVKLMTMNLGHKPYLDNMHSKNVYYVLKASLSTLHNIARCTGVKHHFKDIKTAEGSYWSQNVLVTSHVSDTIKNIVNWIHKALENKQKRRYRGFTPWELTQGLSKLAVNDSNKAKIIEEGALSDFTQMLRHTDPREQSSAAECLWTLAFDKTVRQTIVESPDLVPALEELKNSENSLVKNNVQGALWMIKGENDPAASVSRPNSGNAIKNHIFISYSWAEKEMVKKIHNSLLSEGYKIWVDYEQMGGSTLQAMADAVENAAVVLICMSEKYKQSPNCRTENSKFVFKPIQKNGKKKYRPDGWLGAILGAKLFFDFTGKYPYEKPLQGLLKELRGRGKTAQIQGNKNPSVDEIDSNIEANHVTGSSSGRKNVLSSPTSNPHNQITQISASCVTMSNEHVEHWLVSKGLQRLTSAFSQIDGELIWQLKAMRERAPEYFHTSLERQFGMTLIDILRFNAALDSLH
uniref:TIR domain-containing protein n=1 Tax=Biomphalaria glabrata TaxID=6526 RepID=A0A2C9JLY3_BIOGL